MIRIPVGKYIIKTNGSGYVFGIPEIVMLKSGEEKEQFPKPAYFPSIESMLKCAPDKMVREQSNAKTLRQLLDDLREFQHAIEKATRDIATDCHRSSSEALGGV